MILWDKALEFLVSTIGQSTVDSWRNRNNVDNYLLELSAALPKAQLLIERAECWRLPKYNPIDKHLSLLKYSVYEAESIVNELQYQSLKHKVEKSFPVAQFFRNWVENWMSNFPTEVKLVLDRLNNVYNEMKEICDRRGIPENPNQLQARPITSTFINTSNVYGRDIEFNKVIRLMGVPSSGSSKRKRANLDNAESCSKMDKKWNISVVSIVGMGGVGKTTLAQMVCNDKAVKSYFDLIMWVCVSDNFDSVRLTKEMIESATKNKKECNLTNLNELQKDLQKRLNSKKFLLVLDDVWSKDWQSLLAPMEGASGGSVVLVTARDPQCVKIPGTSIGSRGVINLKGLEEHIYWEFFKSRAFNSVVESSNISPELEVIGKEICKRLKGSPLAAITIGGALEGNPSVEYWTSIRDSKMWELQKEEHDILPVLQLSYQYLPTYLKKCFSFCSLYPKDFKFTQSELTKFWIMQGFIESLDNHKDLTTLANGYFVELVRRGFFQTLARGYVIHDLMHDVCLSITKEECFCLENEQSEQKISLDIRHVSVFQKKLKLEEQKELCKYKKLLSLKVGPNSCCITGMKAWCNVLTNIRSLSVARCKIYKLPKNIGYLKHLQFLDISGTYVKILPESICNLYNLQYLNMMDCLFIDIFPEGFNNLVNLERFENIAKAIQLNYLTVHPEYVPSKEAAQKAQLNNKSFINRLVLEWSRDGENDNEVLDALCPHRNLKELKFQSYKGRNLSPSWLKEEYLPNLTKVEFPNCEFSTISHLPRFITKLVIQYCNQLESLQNLLEPNHLPMLKHIKVEHCKNLESLSVESFGGFEYLEQLIITWCRKLRSPNAMVLPPSVKGLELENCGDLEKSIPSCLQNLTSLETLTIHNCQHLVSIPAEVTSNLKSLSELNLKSCKELQSLEGLQNLKSLSKLCLMGCDKLQSLEVLQNLKSLSELNLQYCKELQLVEGLQNLKSLSKLQLYECNKLQSVGGLQFLASLQSVYIRSCPKLRETKGQNTKTNGKLPSELLEELKIQKEGQEQVQASANVNLIDLSLRLGR